MSNQQQVLIVEDSEQNVLFLSEILEDHGYPYQVTRNGVEALASLRETPPDLVLLDLMMPRKSGLHVLEEIKNDPQLKNIPVIVITGVSQVTGVDLQTGEEAPKEDEGDVVSRQFGAVLGEKFRTLNPDDLIEKPIDPEVLVEKIHRLLS